MFLCIKSEKHNLNQPRFNFTMTFYLSILFFHERIKIFIRKKNELKSIILERSDLTFKEKGKNVILVLEFFRIGAFGP